jgi:hypothetical protein
VFITRRTYREAVEARNSLTAQGVACGKITSESSITDTWWAQYVFFADVEK